MARTGGTVICRCLGCMRSVILLSEIHPHGVAYHDPIRQACDWFNLLTPSDLTTIKERDVLDFPEVITLIAKRCHEREKQLVIRDWTHLDFTALPFLPKPSYLLTTAETLKTCCRVVQSAAVRHPIDQWLSLRETHSVGASGLSLEEFLIGCRRFAEKCAQIGFVRYEDFVRAPDRVTHRLCEQLEIEYDKEFVYKWADYDKVTGDRWGYGRGGKDIKILPRRNVEVDLLEKFERNTDYETTLRLLGYTHPE